MNFHFSTMVGMTANVWLAVAGSSSCVDRSTPTGWADQALKDFDERFKKPDVYEETQCGFVKKVCK